MKIGETTPIHLTYSLNVYPCSSLKDIEQNIFTHAVSAFKNVTEQTGNTGPFGVGLFIPAHLTKEFLEQCAELKERLDREGLYVFTINGFPYGAFHDKRIKENVYKPDWSCEERLLYTNALAHILADLLIDDTEGSISTVPVTFKPWADEALLTKAVMHLMDAAAELNTIQKEKGKRIAIALEPEPGCYLETTDDVVEFFTQILIQQGVTYLSEEYGYDPDDAEEIIHNHIGICIDTVHSAVMFEDPKDMIDTVTSHNIRPVKIHLGGAVSFNNQESPTQDIIPYCDEIYLHQTSILDESDEKHFFIDLPQALETFPTGEWRVHFHVPLSAELKGGLASTASLVTRDFLLRAADAGVRHFEAEIYTLTLMPGFDGNIEQAMADELVWIINKFQRE
jgi:sugar phosphate isomerase/epimerase